MAEYFQSNLDANPWDSARSKTVASTRRGLALQLDGGVLKLLAPPKSPPTTLAESPVGSVSLSTGGLAGLAAGVKVDFGTSTWLVDFGRVGTRSMVQSGAGGVLKRFLGAGALASVNEGKALREGFIEVMTAHGASVTR